MWKMFYLGLLFLPLQVANAQMKHDFYWGINIRSHLVMEKNNDVKLELLPPPDFYLHLGVDFNRYIKIELYGGYVILTNAWNGFDIGLSLKSSIFDRLFISAGLSQNSSSSWGSNSFQYFNKEFLYGNIGGGYLLSKKIYLELMYCKVLSNNKIFGYNPELGKNIETSGRLTFGVGWNFSF